MRSIQQRWIEGTLLLCLCQASLAFQPRNHVQRNRQVVQLNVAIDPNEIVSAVSSHGSHTEIPALLSTMLTSALKQPAHGHSNPLFGPPDQYLAAGKSIAPSAKALVDMGITHAKAASEMVPDASPAFQESAAAAMNKGYKLLNGANIMNGGGTQLPGFVETKGVLSAHNPNVPAETPASFAAEVQWAAGFFNVMDKLPFVAFWYAMVEFFILRPNVDLYKEDVENDPVGVAVETASVAGVRFLAIAFISTVTVGFFG
jgi:hypothetical protein